MLTIPNEIFTECSILFKLKEGKNFKHRNILIGYFEDWNLRLMQKVGKRGHYAKVSGFHGIMMIFY